MKISDIMIHVHPVSAADIVNGRTKIKAPNYIDFFPVIDERQQVVGTIKKDVLMAIEGLRTDGKQIFQALIDSKTAIVGKNDDMDTLSEGICQAVVLDDNQQVVGIVTAARLVRMLKKNLHEFKDQFSAVINSAQNGILAVDSQGKIIIANRAVEEILEVEKSSIIGRPVAEVIANTLMPVILESKKPLLGQKIRLGNTVVMANYSPIISDNEVLGAVSVFQDISLLEDTSSELNYVKGLMYELEAIINSSYDGMFITDAQGNVLRVNKAYERIAGIKAAEILGKDMRQLVEEQYYNQSVTLLVMEKGESITINQTVKNDRKILVTGNPVFDAEGNLFRVVTNVRDVTELTQLQEQLTKTKEQTLKYETELSYLRSMQLKAQEIIFRSNSMAQAIATATKIADVDSTVLITGESGTGKELIAKLIHKRGKGIGKPFIKINCAALPEHLLESELFGYETGAFTGARKEGKPGLFELANNGTLFLDEVGDMPLILQAKLLRAIQDKEFMRVGGTKSIKVNVRIIAATHRNLADMAKEGSFRTDLYYRLVVVPIHLPPLRDRKEDIPLLVIYFIEKFNKHFGYSKTIQPEVIDKLTEYSWPGNVRELENIIERMMVTAAVEDLTVSCLPESFKAKAFLPRRGTKLKTAVEQVETFLLSEAYKEYQSWQKVAEVLAIDRATVYRKAKHYGLLKS